MLFPICRYLLRKCRDLHGSVHGLLDLAIHHVEGARVVRHDVSGSSKTTGYFSALVPPLGHVPQLDVVLLGAPSLGSLGCYDEFHSAYRHVYVSIHSIAYRNYVQRLLKRSVLYFSYFFLRVMKVQMPAIVAKLVTSIQILQMMVSSAIFIHVFYIGLTGSVVGCATNLRVSTISGCVSLSYLYIFMQFYYFTYVKRNVTTHKKD
jgi:hypothetical protein